MKKLGQYFTTNVDLKAKVFEFILNNPSVILEPCIGQGDLITFITDKIPSITFDMYEIDPHIKLLDTLNKQIKIIYTDFITHPITTTYKTIVGNPPFVKTKKGNLYIDFTEKCYHLLEENGELIFIVPSDFFKLTSAAKLLNLMMTNGTFTHVFHPNNEKLFENASIDVIVFRYCKNQDQDQNQNKVLYNDKPLYITNSNGLITFNNENKDKNKDKDENNLFQDYFDIYVGLVTGKEDVYKNAELGNIEVLNGENRLDKYIYIKEYPSTNEAINEHLLKHKPQLMERRIRKFNEKNWFEWGAPRNISTINANLGQDCIYLYNLTRITKKENVAFLGKVGYFGGSLLMLQPKSKSNLSNLAEIVSYLNSDEFKQNFMFSGRFKIGHRQISNSYINL